MCEETRNMVCSGEWDQWNGSISSYWRENVYGQCCCVGTKLYMHFFQNATKDNHAYPLYYQGIDMFARSIGGNRAHMYLMCQPFCDEYINPFAGNRWNVTRDKAWDTLSQIETLPSLQHVDLKDLYFGDADLSGSDLRHSNLSFADLSRADLRCADLRNTNLHWSTLYQANLENADLRGAKLLGNALKHAITNEHTKLST